MKIKITKSSYPEVLALPKEAPFKPKRANMFFRTLLKLVSFPDLIATHFDYTTTDMDKLGKDEPCLYLMNHSSFIDLEIAANILYPRSFNIVATTDSFVGKSWLMRQIGCIPTKKFEMPWMISNQNPEDIQTRVCSKSNPKIRACAGA